MSIASILLCSANQVSPGQTLPSAFTGDDNEITPCYRITHILLPSQSNPALPTSFNLLTPENTDIDTDFGGTTSGAESSAVSGSDTETSTERGDSTDAETDHEDLAHSGVLIDADPSSRFSIPTSAGRRTYASSESDDDEAWTQVDVSSATIRHQHDELPPSPRVPSAFSQPRDRQLSGDWVNTDDLGSDAEGDVSDTESVSSLMDSLILGTAAAPTRTGFAAQDTRPKDGNAAYPFVSKFNLPMDLFPERRAPQQGGPVEAQGGKMTFFEYLYG